MKFVEFQVRFFFSKISKMTFDRVGGGWNNASAPAYLSFGVISIRRPSGNL